MKMSRFFRVLCMVAVVVSFWSGATLAEDRSTGWQCPAGSCGRNATTEDGNYHGYIGNGPNYGYHVGIDYMRDVNYPVYAVDHGVILDYNSSLSGYGNANGGDGGAMLVHHIAKGHDGYLRSFYSVYGHMVKSSGLSIGDIVEKGEFIGNLHFYGGPSGQDWTHLHFGLKSDVEPARNTEDRFRGIAETTASDDGWTHPMNFLDDNFPGNWYDVDCNRLGAKYPDIFQQKGIHICQEAQYFSPNQYVVSYYSACDTECTVSSLKKVWFQVNSNPQVVASSDNIPPGIGYGGGGATSQGSSPIPASGTRPDFTPDFDVYHLDGHEISANCDNCPTDKVEPGQVVSMRLEVETHNRDVQTSDLRNSGTQSIDGKIKCRVVGKTDWQEIPNSESELEYDVGNLVTDNNSSVETIGYTIPSYPGAILECQATVDDDDEVIEESESNNSSRIERFLIDDFSWLVPILNLILND